jgi:hypothetical protein
MDKGIADGTVDKLGRVPAVAKPETESKGEEEEIPENLWAKRSRLLAKAVGTSTKLGELYGDGHVNDSENSQTKLIWAVETALSEARRRTSEGVKPDEGKWLSPEEFGGAMECKLMLNDEGSDQLLTTRQLWQSTTSPNSSSSWQCPSSSRLSACVRVPATGRPSVSHCSVTTRALC